MLIDLHTHSDASDGTDSPAGVIRAAARAGLDVVALTDHDTTRGWAEAADAAREVGVALVRGAELSSKAGGVSVHLLSYLHDPGDVGLLACVDGARDSRVGRAHVMVERIAEDYALTWEDVAAQVAPGATVGRPHIADALVARGHVPTRSEAFTSILASSSPYYVAYRAPHAAELIELVRRAGGVPVLAHPLAASRGRVVSETTIAELAEAGLAGLEADHRDHTAADSERVRAIAARHGLFTTGSSDYHGAGKPNLIGEHTTDPEVLAQIEQLGRMSVVRP